ncbi:MAG: hypothetical protein L0332_23420 [Chloroflexi bacterium]|nr:hypothetical protein [Chloroflexota bacterium]MCI0643552.1 hypothetical protein [Chloroflexota bacterium]MCI0729642.1 hypothetical protein [Chloroflexota bacterium]
MKDLMTRGALCMFLLWLLVFLGPIACSVPESSNNLETATEGTFSPVNSAMTKSPTEEVLTTSTFTVTALSTTSNQFTRSPETPLPTTEIESTSQPDPTESRSVILIGSGIQYWILDTDTGSMTQLPEGYQAYSWSPSGEYLLLWSVPVESRGLYIADSDGSNPRLLEEYTLGAPAAESKWLTDSLILVQNLDRLEPRIFYVDANSGEIQNPEEGYGRTLEAVYPFGEYWIQSIEDTSAIEIADLSGNRVEILQDFPNVRSTTQPSIRPNITLVPSGEAAIFPACVSGSEPNKSECHYWLANVTGQGVESVRSIYNLGEYLQGSQFQVSPDGRYLAFSDIPGWIYFLNLDTYEADYRWPTESGQLHSLIWSPDSRFIAYGVDNIETGNFKLVIINIESGEVTELLDGNGPAPRLMDWQYLLMEQESN